MNAPGIGRPSPSRMVVLAAATALYTMLSACGPRAPAPRILPTEQEYADLLNQLDPAFPGRGSCDAPGYPVADSPRAYAMVLSAEANRIGSGRLRDVPCLGDSACAWLLGHADENTNGITGWGLPFAVDFFRDGSLNPAHTEYTITVGLVINALLDWADEAPQALRETILATATRAIEPYLSSNTCSPSGLFGYSLRASDLKHDCVNPAAYLVGQTQRLSLRMDDPRRADRMRRAADRVAEALLQHRAPDGHGGWCWPYTLQKPRKLNDLCHACFTIDGIRNYICWGGAYAGRFDGEAVYRHLESFQSADGRTWHGRSAADGILRRDREVNLYDLGMALAVVSDNDPTPEHAASLAAMTSLHRLPDGHYAKWPVGVRGTGEANPVLMDCEVFLLYGLSHFLFHGGRE